MLDMQQACLFTTLDSHAKQTSALKNMINNAAPNIEKVRTSESIIKNNAIVPQEKPNAVVTPTEKIEQHFTLVKSKKRPRINNSPGMDGRNQVNNDNNGKTVGNKITKPTKKIIGNKKNDDNCKIEANKMLIKKSFFSMSNVQKCHRNDVSDYLKSIEVNVISCYPVVKRADTSTTDNTSNDDTESTMIRVCIESCEAAKMKNPDLIL
ncbi:hypothetical protein HELRODRAFT_180879 [Helobdella robusta]|uniref:Uncharacterized protein n=1 Tax=Helobdella robusta TaxID=6412 RepID=T1FGC9_HELRO|nr:hypothetical protein HELRODRAFT_180879 [Helobdella robusta]ESN93561.1 hypothetical protein HELRODRAFT_180879 [Helobdella robusta]